MGHSILKMENQLVPVNARVELNGVKIDLKKLKQVEGQLKDLKREYLNKIYQYGNKKVNINSNEQLSELLFGTLKIEPKNTKKGKNGYYTVDKKHLNKLKGDHEIVPLILDYKKAETLLKFCDGLAKAVHPKTGRLHCNLNQIGTATGRFSSSNPNLQNIPNVKLKKLEQDILKILGSKFREVFIPKREYQFVCSDYSQIELRVLAEMSGDSFLVKAYTEDLDIHTLTASEVFNIAFEEVTSEQRSIAKTVNFGLVYGMSAIGLAESLSAITGKPHSKEEAQQIMDEYFNRFSGVKSCLNRLIEQADRDGYSTTLFGRKRLIPQLASLNTYEREKGKRLAMNSPIQGSAADIIKLAMIACDKAISEKNLKSKMILQVHDELLFEVPNEEVEIMKELVKDTMENVVQLSIPLKVGLETGNNWAVAH